MGQNLQFKNGPSKICGRQPKFYFVHSWILGLKYDIKVERLHRSFLFYFDIDKRFENLTVFFHFIFVMSLGQESVTTQKIKFYGLGHIYWRNLQWKTWFFMQCVERFLSSVNKALLNDNMTELSIISRRVVKAWRPVTLLIRDSMFSSAYCETCKNNFFYRTPLIVASSQWSAL